MIPVQEFRTENKEIRDLCEILNLAVNEYKLQNNAILCELLDRFLARVHEHLIHEDRSVYRDLLKQHSEDSERIAQKFLGNTQELKRILGEYRRGWCRKKHSEAEHAKYAEESREIFRLVCDRLNFEEQTIFPLFEGKQ